MDNAAFAAVSRTRLLVTLGKQASLEQIILGHRSASRDRIDLPERYYVYVIKPVGWRHSTAHLKSEGNLGCLEDVECDSNLERGSKIRLSLILWEDFKSPSAFSRTSLSRAEMPSALKYLRPIRNSRQWVSNSIVSKICKLLASLIFLT